MSYCGSTGIDGKTGKRVRLRVSDGDALSDPGRGVGIVESE